MTDRQRDILALAVRAFAHTLSQIEQLAALGRETVERDTFLPLAAQQLGIRLGHDAAALPDSWREARAAVPWRSIRGLRNRLAHDYHQIDFEILWSVFTEHVPEIRRVLATD
ncbi:MAG: HepT-like ribonuclease domain-containing protein, partial [Jiangellaceae bacterium]